MMHRFWLLAATILMLVVAPAAQAQTVDVTGTYDLVHVDVMSGNESQYDAWLMADSGARYRLSLEIGVTLTVRPGSRVRVHGALAGPHTIRIASQGDVDPLRGAQAMSSPQALTTRSVAVVLLNFADNVIEPRTAAAVGQILFDSSNSMNTYYQENTYGELSFPNTSGDTYGYYTMAINTTCDYEAIQQAANDQLNNAGVYAAVTAHDHVMYMMPVNCDWSGLGYINDQRTLIDLDEDDAWIRHVIYHELGHNFGGAHSSGLRCTENGSGVTLTSTGSCQLNSYADPFDSMGNVALRDFSAYHKAQFNFLPSANQYTATAQSGSYTIYPAETSSAGVQSLRWVDVLGQNGQPDFYYYVEFRQPFGIWDTFGVGDPVVNGVSVRLAVDHTSPSAPDVEPVLLDGHPLTLTLDDAAIGQGETFYDPDNHVLLTVTGISSAFATITLEGNVLTPPPPNGGGTTSSGGSTGGGTTGGGTTGSGGGTFTGANDPIIGTNADEYYRGTGVDEIIKGLGGDDDIWGNGGNDRILGGTGRDRIWGGLGRDRLFGDVGDDKVYGGPGDDYLDGGKGRDLISGDAGKDTIVARDRNLDIVRCGAGRDTVTADRIDRVARDCERVKRR